MMVAVVRAVFVRRMVTYDCVLSVIEEAQQSDRDQRLAEKHFRH